MDTDVVKLIESKHEVTILGGLNEFIVRFYGPADTAYEGWPNVVLRIEFGVRKSETTRSTQTILFCLN